MRKSSLIIIIILLIVVIAVGGVFIGSTLMKNQTSAPAPSGGSGLSYDPSAGTYVTPETPPGVAIPGWGSLTIPANTTSVSVDFFNPEANAGYYDMSFELCLSSGESLYKSGLVRAGQHIQKITLSRGLPAGTYDAYLHVQPYTADAEQTPTNNANMALKLNVV